MADNDLRWIYQWIYDDIITERYLTFTIHIIPTVTYIQSIQGYTFSSPGHAWIIAPQIPLHWNGNIILDYFKTQVDIFYFAHNMSSFRKRWSHSMIHLRGDGRRVGSVSRGLRAGGSGSGQQSVTVWASGLVSWASISMATPAHTEDGEAATVLTKELWLIFSTLPCYCH